MMTAQKTTTTRPDPITLDDFKDWAKRHDMPIHVTEEELKQAINLGNAREQQEYERHEKALETGRRLCQGGPVGRDKTEGIYSDADLNPAPGNSLPVYPVKFPAPEPVKIETPSKGQGVSSNNNIPDKN